MAGTRNGLIIFLGPTNFSNEIMYQNDMNLSCPFVKEITTLSVGGLKKNSEFLKVVKVIFFTKWKL